MPALMGRRSDIPWLTIRSEYVSDATATYRNLAEKYGVSPKSISQHASMERWTEVRQSTRNLAQHQFDVALVDDLAQVNADHRKTFASAVSLLEKMLNGYHDHLDAQIEAARAEDRVLSPREMISPRDLMHLLSATKTAIDGERVTLGLPTSVSSTQCQHQREDERFMKSLKDIPDDVLLQMLNTPL